MDLLNELPLTVLSPQVGETPLHFAIYFAAKYGQNDFVIEFLEAGARRDMKDIVSMVR